MTPPSLEPPYLNQPLRKHSFYCGHLFAKARSDRTCVSLVVPGFPASPCIDPAMAAFVDTLYAAGGVVAGHSRDVGGLQGWVVLIGGCSRDANPGARTGIDLDVLSAFSILVGQLYH